MKKIIKIPLGLIITTIIILAFLGIIFFYSDESGLTLFDKIKKNLYEKKSPNELKILSYNVFLRPSIISISDYPEERAQLIGEWIGESDFDIVTLQEAWTSEAVSLIINNSKKRFPYYLTDQPKKESGKATSGGLLVLSRWPIESQRVVAYNECSDSDCLATKGAVHLVIQMTRKESINVITTHLNSGNSKENHESRDSQIKQLKTFIDEIDNKGPLIITGDFNINSLDGTGEYEKLLETLNFEDYHTEDELTINCELEDSLYCEEPTITERLDYIFLKTGETRLLRVETQHLPMRTEDEFKYLSDHRAVLSTFETNFKR
ncbi:MAG: sphingomyelin phosphodiesterase [archaeon]|nr:sphingomyelin phosphodiesterase [archaeon]MCR4323379.1 sphingomyelin phosphodiesterase [Nanoarchaeota archaeon]